MITTIKSMNKYGLTKQQILSLSINSFTISSDFQDCFCNYHLLHWSGKYTMSKISDGSIFKDGIKYLVVYKNCTPSQVRCAEQVKLSFRKPQSEFDTMGYVLIKILEGKKEEEN